MQQTAALQAAPALRRFGLVFSATGLSLALWAEYKGLTGLRNGALALATLAAVLALLEPRTLRPLEQLWMGLGRLMGRVTEPVTLFLIFFGLITPVGLVGRWLGRDPLRLRASQRSTYWIERTETSVDPASFRRPY